MSAILQDKKIVLGVTGGIAVYKAVELLRLLAAAGARVQVVMTRSAQEFVTPLTFQALSGNPVRTALFGPDANPLEHISLAQEVDAIIIAPATANSIGKFTLGLGDDLLSTIILAATRPVLICPAMNVNMYENPVVQGHLDLLRQRGFRILAPEKGEMACGAYGSGRLPEPAAIVEALAELLSPKDLAGYKILVSAGPTHEDLDPVRFLTNRSTGKMGYALARVARRRGAEVCLVSGPSTLTPPPGVERVMVRSALEMQEALGIRFADSNVLIMSAAVSDYRPAGFVEQKMKRHKPEMQVNLVHNPDILASLGAVKDGQFLVGFAAETQDILQHAQEKLERKYLDMIVANDVSAADSGFAVDTNQVTLIHRSGLVESLPLLSKEEVSERVLDRIAIFLAQRQE